MAITYALLPTQVLVVDPAPPVPGSRGFKRVEFSPAEILQAVQAGALLAKKNEFVKSGEQGSKSSHNPMVIYYRRCLIKLFPQILGPYPHHFQNRLRRRLSGTRGSKILFPNEGTPKGDLLEFPILRSPKG